jgi:hypothetical protein
VLVASVPTTPSKDVNPHHLHDFTEQDFAARPLRSSRNYPPPRTAIALVMIASGTIGTAAAYYGDGAEVTRHCYSPGQQIVLGLFIAVLARIDRRLDRARDGAHEKAQISVETERTPPSAIA